MIYSFWRLVFPKIELELWPQCSGKFTKIPLWISGPGRNLNWAGGALPGFPLGSVPRANLKSPKKDYIKKRGRKMFLSLWQMKCFCSRGEK
jgi:hypothetical protein